MFVFLIIENTTNGIPKDFSVGLQLCSWYKKPEITKKAGIFIKLMSNKTCKYYLFKKKQL